MFPLPHVLIHSPFIYTCQCYVTLPTVNVDIFGCIHFRDISQKDIFAGIKIRGFPRSGYVIK